MNLCVYNFKGADTTICVPIITIIIFTITSGIYDVPMCIVNRMHRKLGLYTSGEDVVSFGQYSDKISHGTSNNFKRL